MSKIAVCWWDFGADFAETQHDCPVASRTLSFLQESYAPLVDIEGDSCLFLSKVGTFGFSIKSLGKLSGTFFSFFFFGGGV